MTTTSSYDAIVIGSGQAGPFLLEAGISSSYHIARFFGLAAKARAAEPAREVQDAGRASLVPDDRVEYIPNERVEILRGKSADETDRCESGPRTGQIDVMSIITKALTSAGLMKPPL